MLMFLQHLPRYTIESLTNPYFLISLYEQCSEPISDALMHLYRAMEAHFLAFSTSGTSGSQMKADIQVLKAKIYEYTLIYIKCISRKM